MEALNVLALAAITAVWIPAVIFVWLDVSAWWKRRRNDKRAEALIRSLDLTEPQGRPRLGIRQEEE